MIRATLTILPALLIGGAVSAQVDPFQKIKADMAQAACCRYEFLSILESDIFESVDTTEGSALISADGRYFIRIGPDEYLKTADRFYSYSRTENQLTIENVDPDLQPQQSVSFITRLDDYFATRKRVAGRQYYLRRTDSAAVNLPDSLSVFLTEAGTRLDRLEFLDANDDRNLIVFTRCEDLAQCDKSDLEPHFPDSAQVINLR